MKTPHERYASDYDMRKIINTALFLWCAYAPLQAQNDLRSFVDFHINASTKPFNSRSHPAGFNLWESINNECGNERSAEIILTIGQNTPKYSQSNFEMLVRGNTRLVCLAISPMEQQFLNSSAYLNDKNKKATISCLTGISANQLFLRRKEVDYFQEVVANIEYIKRFEKKPYYVNGQEFTYQIIRSRADVDSVINNPNRLGIVLCVEGGHSLGHSIYINDKITETSEYHDLVIQNVRRLKGVLPVSDNSDDYLDIPVLYLSLCKTFPNGLGGTSLSFNRAQQTIFTRPEDVGMSNTKLGKDVIEALVTSSDGGRPVLIDIKHMSLDFRRFYYEQLDRFALLGTQIPIVASHVGISGLSWRNNLYKKKDDDTKNNNEYLNHWQQNLAEEDIKTIYEYKGIIGITLDKSVLGGELAIRRINDALPHTIQKREACLDLVIANILKAVQVIANNIKDNPNTPDNEQANAWNYVTIGSDFDAIIAPLESYSTARDLPTLYSDIQRFFEAPHPIAPDATGLSQEEIERLRFGLNSTEIADRLMWRNGLEFVRNNIGERPQERPAARN